MKLFRELTSPLVQKVNQPTPCNYFHTIHFTDVISLAKIDIMTSLYLNVPDKTQLEMQRHKESHTQVCLNINQKAALHCGLESCSGHVFESALLIIIIKDSHD